MHFDSPDAEVVRSKLLVAAARFERELGIILDQRELDEIERSGWHELSVERVAEAIMNELDRGIARVGERAVAYWALGKRRSMEMLKFFRTSLCAELDRDADSVYQLLIALDNLDEPVFGKDRNGSVSSTEIELNFRDARSYLNRN